MLKIKLLFLGELLSQLVGDIIKEGKGISIGQRAMAGAAFKLLSASINKMSDKDVARVANVIGLIRTDMVIDGLTQETLTPVEYADLIGHFIEHVNATNSDTTK